MAQELILLAMLNLALKYLEAGGLPAESKSDDARPHLRELIEKLQELQKADDEPFVDWVDETFLWPRGILGLGFVSARNVRANLQRNGFARESQELDDDRALDLMSAYLEEWAAMLALIKEKIEQETARGWLEFLLSERPEANEP
jgi:hypothetical protein